jgi:8-oxo-dGTP diphosphatase
MGGIHVAVAVFNTERKILLVRQSYHQRLWSMPGGSVEHGETPTEAAVRETKEEANLLICPTAFVGAYAAPERDMISLVFEAALMNIEEWQWHPNEEIEAIGFFPCDHLPSPMSERMIHRISDACHGRRGIYREGDMLIR